jgi:hypothetical protein
MEGVKNPILISEYYPKALPEGEVSPEPITRLTPFFHDITIENVKAVRSTNAGIVVGLPESPVKNLVLKNVNIAADKGMTVAYAEVSGSDVHLVVAKGEAMNVAPNAKVNIK